jgi:DNA-binding MarR family transcriptional regulator
MTPTDCQDSAPVAQLEQFLTFRLARVQSKLAAQTSRILRDHAGITIAQWRIIAVLGEIDPCTAAHLSRQITMDKALISRNVKTLIAEDVIDMQRDTRDSRAMRLGLTDKGRQIYGRTFPRMHARQQALRSFLAPEDEAVLARALDKLERAAEDPAV